MSPAAVMRPIPSRNARLAVALALGVLAAAVTAWRTTAVPGGLTTDFDLVWRGARALLSGVDPYPISGPGRPIDTPFAMYYPGTALVIVAPLALLPLATARVLFVGSSTGLLAFAVTRAGWWRLTVFASGAYLAVLKYAQWAPLLIAAALLPPLGGLLVAKPNLGLALGASVEDGRTMWRALLGALALTILSLVVLPHWPAEWLSALRGATHMRPLVTSLGGPLLLTALLRWRRPEARLLAAMACAPLNPSATDLLPLLLVPVSVTETVLVALATCAVFASVERCGAHSAFAACMDQARVLDLWLVYVPCLVMILRRSNEGAVPVWSDQLAERLRVAASSLRRTLVSEMSDRPRE